MSRKYSGQISLRIPPSLHKLLSDTATVEDVSLNQFMTMALAREAGFYLEKGKPKARRGRFNDQDRALVGDDSTGAVPSKI
jgi:uncharacterized protein (DUF1778 family)